MSTGEMNTSLTGEETHSLDGNEVEMLTLLPLAYVFPSRPKK